MFNIGRLSDSIATIVSRELKLDNDNKQIIAYGAFAILQIIISIILVIIFGLLFRVTLEALIICLAGSILRKYSGGAHSGSPNICLVIGTIVCIGAALLISFLVPLINLAMLLLLGLVTFSVSYYLVYKLAPVDSPSKPIKTQKKIDRMKKGSIYVLSTYLIIAGLNFSLYIYLKEERFAVYALCIYMGAAWQSFTLTRLGHWTIKKIDAFFNQALVIVGRRE